MKYVKLITKIDITDKEVTETFGKPIPRELTLDNYVTSNSELFVGVQLNKNNSTCNVDGGICFDEKFIGYYRM